MNSKQAQNNRFNMPIFSKYHESSTEWVELNFLLGTQHNITLATARWLQSGINLHACSMESRKRMPVFTSIRCAYPWKNCICNFLLWDSTNRGEQSKQTTCFWQMKFGKQRNLEDSLYYTSLSQCLPSTLGKLNTLSFLPIQASVLASRIFKLQFLRC